MQTIPLSLFAIGSGAALGAWLRWQLAQWLNPWLKSLPAGTLAANLLGGLLIGLVAGLFMRHGHWPHGWRLFLMTGFLGGLTTFSTFSLEVVSEMRHGAVELALANVALNLLGSLLLTWLGLRLVDWLS